MGVVWQFQDFLEWAIIGCTGGPCILFYVLSHFSVDFGRINLVLTFLGKGYIGIIILLREILLIAHTGVVYSIKR